MKAPNGQNCMRPFSSHIRPSPSAHEWIFVRARLELQIYRAKLPTRVSLLNSVKYIKLELFRLQLRHLGNERTTPTRYIALTGNIAEQ